MMFPDVERVVYDKNPLVEVVCQLRFPRIFALDTSVPSDFQLELGGTYPQVEIRQNIQISIQENQAAVDPLRNQIVYEFSTEDHNYTISICSEYIAVRTLKYRRWEDFFPHIKESVRALTKCYPVKTFTRVGLRYIDAIDRAQLELSDLNWSDLVEQPILGVISKSIESGATVDSSSSTAIISSGNDKCNFVSGLNTGGDESQQRFIIDTDFYCDLAIQGENDVFDRLARYNKAARNAFRWAITPTLHSRLGPRSQNWQQV